MKNRIAVFTNGYSNSDNFRALNGMKEFAAKKDFDIHIFSCFTAYDENEADNIGNLGIYDLPDTSSYDGVIVFSNFLNSMDKINEIFERLRKDHIPAVSIGMKIDGFPFIGCNNETGMHEIVTHLIEKHDVKRIAFIGGTEDHPDSRLRLKVTKDVLKEHGLSFDERDLYYGLWANEPAEDAVHDLIGRPEGLPDAIVVANDVMGLAATTELVRLGYNIPQDVIVTGFDHREDVDTFYPGLTTVEPDYYNIGYEACRTIYDMLDGKPPRMEYMTGSKMIIGESCGCSDNMRCVEARNRFCHNSHLAVREERKFNRNTKEQRLIILNSESYHDMKVGLSNYYLEDHLLEGNDFSLVVNPRYIELVMSDEKTLLSNGYENAMEPLTALKDGQLVDAEVSRSSLIPGYEKIPGKQSVYVFYPLHVKQYNYGYMCFKIGAAVFNDVLRIFEYLEKMQHSFVEYRINTKINILNRELTRLYDKDPMTGLYNRFCYEEKVNIMFKKSIANRSKIMIMFIDINNMKKINDHYGHLYGDKAICIVADAIKAGISEAILAVRFGGDEFLLAASEYSIEEAESLKDSINRYIDKQNDSGIYPFRFTVSIGYVITDPTAKESIQDYVHMADELMYDIKRIYHETHPN